ncbi:MAG: DUF350 domain-containing protein [Deltaproteobacteria bacterium]|nr:DUF350 domain-containing protein [Deltaproteobacteria bacterium]MBF0524040.1 DUF350 domain-containing protein [Deltaproteobacteria bacterium]
MSLSLSGLLGFLSHFVTAMVLLYVFAKIYDKVTPYREFDLIAEGNTAAACSFCGALLGFAVPLASAIIHSAGLLDMIVWAAITFVVQLLTFIVVRKIFPTIVADIPANQISKGIFLGFLSLIVGILNAACIS